MPKNLKVVATNKLQPIPSNGQLRLVWPILSPGHLCGGPVVAYNSLRVGYSDNSESTGPSPSSDRS